MTYQLPNVEEHTGTCRVLLYAWRMRNTGLPAVNRHEQFPCSCAETGGTKTPWRLVPAEHPDWCVVEGEHPWTDCTITVMVPKGEGS